MTVTDEALAIPLRPVALVRDTPRAVWLLVALTFLLGALYATAIPLLHGPDEHAHADLLLNVSDHLGVDPYEGLGFDRRTFTAMARRDLVAVDWRSSPVQPWTGLAGGAAPPRTERPRYEDLEASGPVGVVNTANTHPPLYYAVTDGAAAVARAILPVRWSWDREVVLFRLVSAALVAPLPWFVFWGAMGLTRRFEGEVVSASGSDAARHESEVVSASGSDAARRRVALTAAVVPVAIPQLTHLAGAVNNDALLMLLTAALSLVLVWVVRGDLAWRTAALAGGLAGLGVLTKVFALPAPLWIVAAYAVAWRRGGRLAAVAGRLGVAAATTVVFGGWWVLRQLVVEGTLAPRPFLYPQPPDVQAPLGAWLDAAADRLASTFWGNFGVEQFTLPGPLIVAATVLLLVAVGFAVAARAPDRDGPGLAVVLLPALTTLAMVLYAAWSGYQRSGLPTGLHGRYLFVGAVGLGTAVAVGASRALERGALPAVGGFAVALQAAGLVTVVGSYWEGDGVLGDLLAAFAWAPWQARWSVLLLVATAAVAVATVVMGRREAGPGSISPSVAAGPASPPPRGEP